MYRFLHDLLYIVNPANKVYIILTVKGHVVSLSKNYSNCLVLVGSRNGFEHDLHNQKIACFTIELK